MDSKPSSHGETATPPSDVDDKFATTREPAASAAPMSLLLKSAGSGVIPFGRYEILRVLGEGAMGSVYLARDTQLERQVAIKVPKLDDGDRADLHRFYREARTMATLRHPHLCPVYDVGEQGGVHFFTMAYIEGGTLVDYLVEDVGLPDRQVARLIAKTASALDAAHKAGIVHRDLKPANIMIDRNKEPVVMDFGLAGVADANANLTQWGEMLGTPAFMAPEQIRGDLDMVGPASDIYSLGAIMYQMLTGRVPFDGSVATVVRKALESEPAELTSLANHIDSELNEICLRAMAKDPRDRFVSASEMANALRDFLLGKHKTPANKPTTAPAASSIVTQLDQQARRARELWGEARFTDVLPILEGLARRTEAPAAPYASWASEEIPKVLAKIEQAAQADDWLSLGNTSPPSRLSPPVRYLASSRAETLPSWLMWSMAAPAAVILLLVALVIASKWSDVNAAREQITTNPQDAEPNRITTSETADSTGQADATSGSEPQQTDEPAETSPTGEQAPNTSQHDQLGPRPGKPERPLPNAAPARNGPGSGDTSPLYGAQGNPSQSPQRPGPPPRRPRPPPPRNAAGILRDLDFNRDGQLSASEIPPNHRPHLMRADTNGDNILSRAELEAFLQQTSPPLAPR